MQDVFNDHASRAIEFYKQYLSQFTEQSIASSWELTRKLSKKCAFTFEKLKIPIRAKQCTKLKCVYEYDTIMALLKNEEERKQKDYYLCIMCEQKITKSDLFYDQELAKALKTRGPCLLKFIKQQPNQQQFQQQLFILIDKDGNTIKQTLPELPEDTYQQIENASNQTLLNVLALNIYKQRMETLLCLANNNDNDKLKKFGRDQLDFEMKKYIK